MSIGRFGKYIKNTNYRGEMRNVLVLSNPKNRETNLAIIVAWHKAISCFGPVPIVHN